MIRLPLLLFLVLSGLVGAVAMQGDQPAMDGVPSSVDPDLRKQAEGLYAEGSYAMALELYEQLSRRDVSADERRWIDFRVLDCRWRSLAATTSGDRSGLDETRQRLDQLIQDAQPRGPQDRIVLEARESMGDFWWVRPNQRNWGQAWRYYSAALEGWAGSRSIDEARERYLGIVRKAARPPRAEPYYFYGYYGNLLPAQILRNVLKITDDPTDRAHAHYLLAMGSRQQAHNDATRRRTADLFEAALDAGRDNDWYDDALYHYAEWLAQPRNVLRADEEREYRPEYPRAIELFRRLLSEFAKGETRYHDQARRQIETLTAPSVGVSVSNVFLPDSEPRYHLSWRNVDKVRLALYEVDLGTDVAFDADTSSRGFLAKIATDRRPAITWEHATNDRGDHVPGSASLTLDDVPGVGAYVLEATAEDKTARELVLVTGGTVVLKASGNRALVYLCDALDGSPWADGSVTLWARHRSSNRAWRWDRIEATTDREGLAVVELPDSTYNADLFVAASRGEHQAFTMGNSSGWYRKNDAWRVYAFTDRPAYRPGETAEWKITARVQEDGRYRTPSGEGLRYEIQDPRGTKVDEGTLDLNRFGSAWSRLELTEAMPLGEYRVTFFDRGGSRHIGAAVLFRLEEYKLPEFKVSVTPPIGDDGRPETLRVGDAVEAEIVAEYYFGGPVAGASAEVVVHQKPLYVVWPIPREFPWFFDDVDPRRGWTGPGQIVHRETLTTDADGRARVRFETPEGTDQDLEYSIEVRVTDASRREIVGSGTVRASRQRYFAFVRAAHQLYRPGDEVRVEIRTADANDAPFAAEGRVVVTREHWVETWIDPHGREVTGSALERARRKHSVFPPPPPQPGDPGWRLRHRGYEQEEILSRTVRTGDDGTTDFEFRTDREGYYRVTWKGDENELYPVTADATVWVADRDSADLGFRPGGVQILVDRDTVRAGQTAAVMLAAPVEDSWVLFTVEGEGLYEHRLVHLSGRVKLLELDVDERFVPNVFLEAVMVHDAQLLSDTRQVVVPPVEHFLDVEVEADRESYLPGQEGTLRVTTRGHDGEPVAAEVALALIDESVFYIQEDYAGDPRKFFFGDKRPKLVRTSSSFQYRRYARDEPPKDDTPIATGVRADERRRLQALGYASEEFDAAPMELAEGVVRMAAPAPARMMQKRASVADDAGAQDAGAVQVRSDFRSTVVWAPDVVTGDDGTATVEVTFPDSLTTWRATARAASDTDRFGIGGSEARTSKPLIARLQAPRFFVERDTVTLSVVINNNTDDDLDVAARLEAEGLRLDGVLRDGRAVRGNETKVRVPAGGEARVNWLATVEEPGAVRLRTTVRGGGHSDAMERTYTAWEHGIEKLLSRSGKVRGDEVRVTLDLPRERRDGSTSLTVQVTPSVAVTMLDALPYLIDYPYGCTEQTMSRFMPSIVVARTLESLGIERELVASRLFGGIEARHAGDTHPKGKKDLAKLDSMVGKGLKRLYDFQHGDGGWGWWKKGDSDHFMTAYVVWGLALAQDAGVDVRDGVVDRAATFLARELVERENQPDLQAFMLHALSALGRDEVRGDRARFAQKALDNLWENRDRLNAYTRALLALASHQLGDDEKAQVLVRNLANGVKRDRSPDRSVLVKGSTGSDAVLGTAHWGEDGIYWRWSDGGVEATAFALRALLAIDPDHELVEPVTNWLVRNRRGAQWSNTRDTAITVLALSDYLEKSGELASELEYEVLVNGKSVAKNRVTPADVLAAPSRFAVDGSLVRDGANEIRIVQTGGDGPLYFAAEARFFSMEEPVAAAGSELFVRREYYRLAPRPTLLRGFVYEKTPLRDGDTLVSGERVEVVMTIEAKNDYEYLVFEDLKPAGLEAVQIRSGESFYARQLTAPGAERESSSREHDEYTGRTRWVHQELRDRKVALFADRLSEGFWEMRYELRAEVPGTFHALPLMGHAMYVPEIRGNSDEIRVTVVDESPEPQIVSGAE